MEMFAYRLYLPLYRVADRYQADEAVLVEHRHMAEFAFRHAVHNAADRIVYVAGEDVTRHHLRNRQLHNGTSDIRHCAHDVALRQNADEALAGVEDDQRTDAVRREQLRRRRQIGCRFDADDVAALGGKNGLQAHARLRQGRLRTDFMVGSEVCLSRQKVSLWGQNGGADRAIDTSGVTLTPDVLGAVRPLRLRGKRRRHHLERSRQRRSLVPGPNWPSGQWERLLKSLHAQGTQHSAARVSQWP